MTLQLETIIGNAWENRANINAATATAEVRQAVEHVIAELDAGRLRVDFSSRLRGCVCFDGCLCRSGSEACGSCARKTPRMVS